MSRYRHGELVGEGLKSNWCSVITHAHERRVVGHEKRKKTRKGNANSSCLSCFLWPEFKPALRENLFHRMVFFDAGEFEVQASELEA